MTPTAAVQVEFDNSVARIIFDQPNSRANTLSTAVWNELAAAVAAVAGQAGLTAVIVCSRKDGMFIAGADLKELHGLIGQSTAARSLLQKGLDVLAALEALPLPTVAMIDGAALGGGLEVALACDYRVVGSHPKCKLGLPEVKLGLIPGWGGTQRLPRLVGLPTALAMLTSGKSNSSLEACAIGLADDSVPSNNIEAAAIELAGRQGWQQRRQRRSGPVQETASIDPNAMLEGVSTEERPAAVAAVSVAKKGSELALSDATAFETDAFIPLLNATTARQRIEGFLKK